MSDSESILVHSILIISSLFIAVLAKLFRPEKPNNFAGYRTKRSLLSQHTWDFANEYAGNLIMWASLLTIVIEIFSYFTMEALTSVYVTAGVMTAGLFTAIAVTEYQLKHRFDKEGNPIQKTGDRY